MGWIVAFIEKLCRCMAEKGVIKNEDIELYRYGIRNGIILAGNLIITVLVGIVTGRLGVVLAFLLFFMMLRSYSGGFHLESKLGCFLLSVLVLLVPIYTCDWVMKNVPEIVILLLGVAAIITVIVLSPVESIHKRLEPKERVYFRRVSHCIVTLEGCAVIFLYVTKQYPYFYAGYSSILLTAASMLIGQLSSKHYT